MSKPDPRLHAFRPDLADARLEGRVEAERFVTGRRMQVMDPTVSVRNAPRFDAMQITQALLGETLQVFDVQEGWAWVQLEADGYVGYVSANALSQEIEVPTHRVSVPSTFLYPQPNLKTQPANAVTMNAQVKIAADDGPYARLSNGGFVYARHIKPLGDNAADFVAVAEQFLHVPYYWGGKSVDGLDCSGLVQLPLQVCGMQAPRDTDMQEKVLGSALSLDDPGGLRRGDLVFWKGHVGIMTDSTTLLHANGYHMQVVSEPLHVAVERIARSYGQVTSIRRI